MAERFIPADNTLVKYNNPVLVTESDEKKLDTKDGTAQSKTCVAPEVSKTEEILNTIIPPREWSEEGQLWRQQVSSTPATRLEIVNLAEMLDMRLQQKQARETGICPVRRELYNQCFDELIRQVTINCAERGVLLLRLRDEIRMTLEAYKTLYCSSVAFGMRKALQAEKYQSDYIFKLDKIEDHKNELEKKVMDLKTKAEQIERRGAEVRETEERRHAEEIQRLKRTNTQLKAQLEGIIVSKK